MVKLKSAIVVLLLVSLVYSSPVIEYEDQLDDDRDLWSSIHFDFLETNSVLNEIASDSEESGSADDDADLTVPQIIRKYGYKVEIHHVVTEDGYILEMHRIPKPGGKPVYLQHGLMDSSAGWIIAGPQSALGYYLSDLGYDVWMGNNRGNLYSRNHTTLDPNSKEFWDFSFHEIGLHDFPAMIDKIIEETKVEKIHYVGHSQGTTGFWVMCSEKPKYCDKILSMNALAPIAYMSHLHSPVLRGVALIVDELKLLENLFGEYEVKPTNGLLKWADKVLCEKSAMTQSICTNILFLICGYDSKELNRTMLPVVLAHIPAGASTKQFIHYGQLINVDEFRQFSYGFWVNKEKYNQFSPPKYNLSNVNAPVFLHYSTNDWLSAVADVYKLSNELPNATRILVQIPTFNHLDYLLAIDSRKYVYTEVVKRMKSMENQ